MKHATLSAAVLVAALLPASAFAALRAPQVVLSGAGANLQTQINLLDEGPLDVTTAQENIQSGRWRTTVSGNSSMTLQIELGGNAAANAIGVYSAVEGPLAPAGSQLLQMFPITAQQGWFALAAFRTDGTLRVHLFNSLGDPVSDITYPDINIENFSFYIQNDQTMGFAQDFLNPGGEVRALTYKGTQKNEGCWFLCFEDGLDPLNSAENQDFDEAILFLESVNPTPVTKATWASVKARFR